MSTFLLYFLPLVNVLSWWCSNGMNGIAIQTYALKFLNEPFRHQSHSNAMLRFIQTLIATCMITSIQLLLGALLGYGLLSLLNRQITWKQITNTHWPPLSILHAVGSLVTNLGFMYGKASVIQGLKLLEPFETLALSKLFFREGNTSVGVLSSMSLVVCAAISLLKIQTTKTDPLAIVFALLSGVTLSTRNVLQRKHFVSNDGVQGRSERSIAHFTQISFYSGLGMLTVSTILFAALIFLQLQTSIPPPSIGLIMWHPLYNVFSMITLGFSSALTHSLLNVGKRIVSIIMAVFWFQEGITVKMFFGLLLVLIGGLWYGYESKQPMKKSKDTGLFNKPILSLVALSFLVMLH